MSLNITIDTPTPAPARLEGSPADPWRSVRKARADEIAPLSQVLARAFEDDPVSAWVFPNSADRLRRMELMYRLMAVPDALGEDECYTTGDYAGVALWAPAGKAKPGLAESLRLIPTVARVCGRHTPRAVRVLSFMESKFPEEPHAHLMFLGTEPERQGQGVGSLLLRQNLARLDREGIPAYLEASTARNRALYLRHGFVDMDRMQLPGGGPRLWRMWRDPA
jgi:ribosomal protein S18 acetylase RimI-like enzyme